MNAFEETFCESVDPMIKRGEIKEAFEVSKEVFRILNQVEMDGSGGEHGMIASCIASRWEEMILSADEQDREMMHQWFKKMSKNADDLTCGDYIKEVYENSFYDEKYLLQLLEEVKSRLDPWESAYELKYDLELYRKTLQRLDRDLDEYEKWLSLHEDLMIVLEIYLEQAEEEHDVDRQIEILYRLIEKSERIWNKNSYRRSLLKLYSEKNDRNKQKEILKELTFSQDRADAKEVRALRALCESKEWEDLREKILKKNPSLKPEFYFEEKLYGKLAKTLPDYPIDITDRYRKALLKDHSKEVLKRYIDHLYLLEKRSPCVTLYEEMKKYFLIIADLENGKKELDKLMKHWERKYPTRKALHRTINEVRKEKQFPVINTPEAIRLDHGDSE